MGLGKADILRVRRQAFVAQKCVKGLRGFPTDDLDPVQFKGGELGQFLLQSRAEPMAMETP